MRDKDIPDPLFVQVLIGKVNTRITSSWTTHDFPVPKLWVASQILCCVSFHHCINSFENVLREPAHIRGTPGTLENLWEKDRVQPARTQLDSHQT